MLFASFMSLITLFLYSNGVDNGQYVIKNDTVYSFSNNYMLIHSDLKSVDTVKIRIPKEYPLDEFYTYILNNEFYFFKKTGGLLLKKQGDSIFRIDNSYDHRLQSNSLNFVYDNTLNSIGGYGFFERRKVWSYFDWENHAWNVRDIDLSYLDEGISNVKFHYVGHEFVLVFGYQTSNSKNYNEFEFSNDILKYSLDNKTVEKIGELSHIIEKYPLDSYQYNDLVFLLYHSKIVTIDVSNFKLGWKNIDFDADRIVGVIKDDLVLMNYNDFNNSPSLFKKDLKDVIPESFEYSVFKPSIWKEKLGVVFLFLSFLIYIFLKRKSFFPRRNKFLFKGKDLVFNNKKVKIFNQREIEFLYFITQRNGLISNNEFLTFLGNSKLDLGHQNRVKKLFIEEINLKSKTLNGKKLIIDLANKEDKRLKDYKLNSLIFLI